MPEAKAEPGMTVSPPLDYYFPGAGSAPWERVGPEDLGWDGKALEEALEFAGRANSTGMVVLCRGRIVAERYWGEGSIEAASDCFSVQKSLVSVLIGIAMTEGRLRMDDPVDLYLGKGWSRSPETEGRITVRHLVTMTSGLTNDLRFAAEPGSIWAYNTPAYQLTKTVLERATGVTHQTFTRDLVWGRTGADHSRWEMRANMPFTGWVASTRDLARFGLMVLAGGTWNGAAILKDKAYLRASLESSQDLNLAYGYLWWLNGRRSHLTVRGVKRDGALVPEAPADMVQAAGAGDKRIYIVPGQHVVVARHGGPAGQDATDVGTTFDSGFWRLFRRALPA
ncbi:MAG TPA: serine hydrolase domain-containing protein [Dehalococcoidia bacterium]|nr:serine hydrolase domain-containing protein [Dehalococcoidia bacterium]